MYKKYIGYIRRVPFSVILYFFYRGVVSRGGVIFSKTELAEAGEAPQC